MAIFYYDLHCFHLKYHLNSKISSWNKKEAQKKKIYFKNFHFIIHSSKKPLIKHMKSVDLLHQPPFPDKLSIEKMSKAFKGYARTYKIKMIDSKHPLA